MNTLGGAQHSTHNFIYFTKNITTPNYIATCTPNCTQLHVCPLILDLEVCSCTAMNIAVHCATHNNYTITNHVVTFMLAIL